jgi:aminoglycoside phosphotransferase (APT) family kinase protein
MADVSEVRQGHEMDLGSLDAYIKQYLSFIPSINPKIKQFTNGQSNPTFLLHYGTDCKLVVRKKVGLGDSCV